MNLVNYMDDFETQQFALAFSRKKETYRVSIRRAKIQQALSDNRERVFQTNNTSRNFERPGYYVLQDYIQSASVNDKIVAPPSVANQRNIFSLFFEGKLTEDELSSHFQQYPNSEEQFLRETNELYQSTIQNYQYFDCNQPHQESMDQLMEDIKRVVAIEKITKTQIIQLNDILFLTRMMNTGDTEQKIQVISLFSVLYHSQRVKQNIISYFIQYINMDKLEVTERILDILIEELTQLDTQLISKLSQPFFYKTFMRLLSLKGVCISTKILKIATLLLSNNSKPNPFLQSLLQNQSSVFQLLSCHLEFKNIILMIEIADFVSTLMSCKSECEEDTQSIIQYLIDSQLISKVFEIFTSESRLYSFLKTLIITIFSNANHFQIEHFFDSNLKYFIMNHLINCLTSPNLEHILQALQFTHQLLFQEKEYNQQDYYPRKKIIQSLDIQVYIKSFAHSQHQEISNEALFILKYL